MATVDYATLKKGGFMRQKQKNHFSLRIQVTGGNLSTEQLTTISQVAETFGKGHVHLTSRQSVEIPYIRLEDVDAVKEALEQGGCRPGVCGPRVRTVTACQGEEVCPSGNIDTYQIAVRLNERYFGKELPHKFKFGVTGCQNNCLKAEENDVGIKGALLVKWAEDRCIHCGVCEKVCRTKAIVIEGDQIQVQEGLCNNCGRCAKSCPTDAWDIQKAYQLSFGGLFGNVINKGEVPLPFITEEEKLYQLTDAAVEFFAEYGQSNERFRFTIDRVGMDVFVAKMKEVYDV